jgi:uridylate kinase
MNTPTPERIVVSVGGSLIVPEQIDADFLTRLKTLILEKIQQGFSFAIIAGGGKTARHYQEIANSVTKLTHSDIDWIGIHATRLNAQLLRNIFYEFAHPQVITDPTLPVEAKEPIIIAGGWKPGWSTDYCAVMMAKNIGAKRLANLTNIDYVYDRNPLDNPLAKKIEKIGWEEFRSLIPPEWDPGLSSPFDPIAAKEAESLGLEVAIVNGANLGEFSNYLDGKAFVGTVIS